MPTSPAWHHLVALLLLPLCLLPAGSAAAADIEGILLTAKGPASEAKVHAYRNAADLQARINPIVSTPGSKPGHYTLRLAPGKYYLTATAQEAGGQPLFAYHGLNPITVGDDYQWIPFFVQPAREAQCESGYQGIGGRVIYKDAPLAHGSVSVYTLEDAPFRGMGVLTNSLGDDGAFWFDLAPGRYMVIARQRQNDSTIGPLQQGDLFCYSAANPIEVSPARACKVDLFCYPRNDLDHYLDQGGHDPRGRRQETRRDASLKQAGMQEAGKPEASAPQAILAGRVIDLEGRPMPGLIVTAYPADDLPLFQMYVLRFRSDFIAKTDSKGMFRLEVRPGPYYLVARERVGDAPQTKEYYGLYEGNANHSLTAHDQQPTNGIQITVAPIMP